MIRQRYIEAERIRVSEDLRNILNCWHFHHHCIAKGWSGNIQTNVMIHFRGLVNTHSKCLCRDENKTTGIITCTTTVGSGRWGLCFAVILKPHTCARSWLSARAACRETASISTAAREQRAGEIAIIKQQRK